MDKFESIEIPQTQEEQVILGLLDNLENCGVNFSEIDYVNHQDGSLTKNCEIVYQLGDSQSLTIDHYSEVVEGVSMSQYTFVFRETTNAGDETEFAGQTKVEEKSFIIELNPDKTKFVAKDNIFMYDEINAVKTPINNETAKTDSMNLDDIFELMKIASSLSPDAVLINNKQTKT